MPFTDPEKTDIRRFCGYPAYGAAPSSLQTWRFYQAYGLLEFRINNLSDAESAVVRRYLGTLTVLEHAVPRAADNLDTDQATVWTRNRDELRDRIVKSLGTATPISRPILTPLSIEIEPLGAWL
jgi:hypothetical protein